MRATGWLRPSALLFLLLLAPRVSHADIAVGATAPAYTKTALGGSTSTLSQYSGKVVVLFLLGYGCPFCQSNCPSVQTDIQDFYQQSHPGQLQVIGADLWNGTTTQLNQFKTLTGAQTARRRRWCATSRTCAPSW